MTDLPLWQAHVAKNYDTKMRERCGVLLQQIQTDPQRRGAILTDPRSLHRELFLDLVPQGHEEYAGTYRGAEIITLTNRRAHSASALGKASYEFVDPKDVAASMNMMLSTIAGLRAEAATDYDRLMILAYSFALFGAIHPFLDGNGHVQRAFFAAMAIDLGYSVNARFAIHPRPFDALMAIALELFTRAGTDWARELPLVAEYLSYFIEGPFAAGPRTFLPVDAGLY